MMYQKAAGRGTQGLLLSHQLIPGVSLRRKHLDCIFAFPHLYDFTANVRTGSCSGVWTAGGRCHRWKAGLAPSAVRAKSSSSEKVSKRRPESSHTDKDGDLDARLGTGRRLKLVVAYDGSEYAGFQVQTDKVRTVQGELERCAKRLFHGCSRMVGASRTDAGAHAYGQVVHFDVYGTRDSLESDMLYYNSFLPPTVRVLSLSYAEDGFDSHFSSCGKTYVYKFAAGLPDPLQSKHRWWLYDRWCERSRGKPSRLSDVELDVLQMQLAADLLLGRHDFSAFMDNRRPTGLGSAKRKSPKFTERSSRPERSSAKNTRILSYLRLHHDVSPVSGGQEVTMEVTGNGFLYRMVRMLAAGLVEVGHHRLSPAGLRELMLQGNRAALPEAAPPHGLYLARVHYRGDPEFEARVQSLACRMKESTEVTSEKSAARVCDRTSSEDAAVGALGVTQLRMRESPLLSEGVGALTSGVSSTSWLDARAHFGLGPELLLRDNPQGGAGCYQLEGGMKDEVAGDGDVVEGIVRELRMTQGQKAAALMRVAALERRGEGVSSAVAAGAEAGDVPSASAVSPPAGEVSWSQVALLSHLSDRDREDDQ